MLRLHDCAKDRFHSCRVVCDMKFCEYIAILAELVQCNIVVSN